MRRFLPAVVSAAALSLVCPLGAVADDDRDDFKDFDDDDTVLIQRLTDDMYEMIQDRFEEKIDIQRAVLEIDGDEVEFVVRLVSDGRAYDVEFEPGERRIDDDDIDRLDGKADPDRNDDYDDDQHR